MKYSRECSGCSHDTCSVITGMLRRSLYSMPDAARSTFTLFCFSFDFSAMLCLTLSTRLLLNITVINQSLRAIRKRDVQLLWFRNYPFPAISAGEVMISCLLIKGPLLSTTSLPSSLIKAWMSGVLPHLVMQRLNILCPPFYGRGNYNTLKYSNI